MAVEVTEAEADAVLVICVGMPLRRVGELAQLLRDQAVVVAAPDVDGALTLLREDRGVQAEAVGASRPDASVAVRPDEAATEPSLSVGPLRIARAARDVSVSGVGVHLSAQEFDLLALLASDVDRVWSFEDLTARVWRTAYLGDRDHVNSAIKRLRRRLAPHRAVKIVSVRGVGYRLVVARASSVPTPLADALRLYDRAQARHAADDAA